MAKRGRKAGSGGFKPDGGADEAGIGVGPNPPATQVLDAAGARPTEDALGDFAADMGKLLGTVQNRATSWLDQRKAITDQLTQIRDTANKYLQDLRGAQDKGGDAPFPMKRRGRRGRPPGSGGKHGPGRPKGSAAPADVVAGGGKKKRTMSPEARQRIGDAQRARWAKQKKAGNK